MLRDVYENAAKASFEECLKAVKMGAIMEGGIELLVSTVKKRREKPFTQFEARDWLEIGTKTCMSSLKGGVRGGSLYALTNYAKTPAPIATAMITAVFGIAENLGDLQKGNQNMCGFITKSETVAIDASVSALSALIGQAVIPIPIVGPLAGNIVGTLLFGVFKNHLSEAEQTAIETRMRYFKDLETCLSEKQMILLEHLKDRVGKFDHMMSQAFSNDVQAAFHGSTSLATVADVKPDLILKSKSDIDKFFLS